MAIRAGARAPRGKAWLYVLLVGMLASAVPSAVAAVPARPGAVKASASPGTSADRVSFGPKTVIGRRACHPADVVARPDATVIGFTQCGSQARITFIRGKAGRWVTEASPFVADLIAVADDGRKTYALVVTLHDFRLVVRDSAGKYSSTFLAHSRFVHSAGLVARDGKWLAVWAEQENYETPEYLYEAGTWAGARQQRKLVHPVASRNPELTVDGQGDVYLAYETYLRNAAAPKTLLLSKRQGGEWASPRVVGTAVTDSALAPELVADASRLLVSYTENGVPVLAESADGGTSWRKTYFETDWGAQRTSVAASVGSTYIAFSENTGQNEADGTYGTIWVRRPGRPFVRTVLTPDVRAIMHEEFWTVVASRGKATALLSDEAGRLYATSQA